MQKVSVDRPGLGDPACRTIVTLPPQIATLVAAHSLSITKIERLTTLPSKKMSHASFKAVCDDGQVIKLRLVETAEQADRVSAIRAQLPDDHFPQLLGKLGCVMIEQWIPGHCAVEKRYDVGFLREAGALLATLHSAAVPNYSFAKLRTPEDRLRHIKHQAGDLLERGRLTSKEVATIICLARHDRPGTIDAGIIHRDFAAENLVIGDDQKIWVIDNETMNYDALSFDLARVWYRWPLAGPAIVHFLTGYGQVRSTEDFERHFIFWTICALIDACLFRVRAETRDQDVPIHMLRQLISNPDAAHPKSWRFKLPIHKGDFHHKKAHSS